MKVTPRWVSVALAVGAVVTAAWAPFIYQFTSEVSSDHRSRTVLVAWTVISIVAAVLALVGAIGVLRGLRSSRLLASTASIVLVLTLVGALPGIAALMGLWSSRDSTKP